MDRKREAELYRQTAKAIEAKPLTLIQGSSNSRDWSDSFPINDNIVIGEKFRDYRYYRIAKIEKVKKIHWMKTGWVKQNELFWSIDQIAADKDNILYKIDGNEYTYDEMIELFIPITFEEVQETERKTLEEK